MSITNRITNIEISSQGRDFFFTLNEKSKYKIPSKMFPISRKKDMAILGSSNTVPFHDESFLEEIDKIDLPVGMCYQNSDRIGMIGERLGLHVQFYSGWVLRAGDMPKHHAWLMVAHEDGFSIVDSFKDRLFREAEKRSGIDISQPGWRKELAKFTRQVSKEMPLNSQQIVIGQVLNDYLYVGSPDTADNARKIFNQLAEQFPKHPSYKGEGSNMEGRNKMQEELLRYGIK